MSEQKTIVGEFAFKEALIPIYRVWAMPNKNTLEIAPIRSFVEPFIKRAAQSIDPFAGNCQLATITNDLNPSTKATYHMDAIDFLKEYKHADVVIFDPPYSLRQVKECYEGVGRGFTKADSQNAIRWTKERDIIASNQGYGDYVLSFGWSSSCMGKKRGYEITAILLVAHGAGHHDTICVAERKL